MSNTINPLWIAYNNLHNEGGEGYNPHDKYITSSDGEPEWSKLDDRRYRLVNIQNGTSTSDPRFDELGTEIETLVEAIKIARASGV